MSEPDFAQRIDGSTAELLFSDLPERVGLHRVRIVEIAEHRVRVADLEALEGTPIVDVKPVLTAFRSSSGVLARSPRRGPLLRHACRDEQLRHPSFDLVHQQRDLR